METRLLEEEFHDYTSATSWEKCAPLCPHNVGFVSASSNRQPTNRGGVGARAQARDA